MTTASWLVIRVLVEVLETISVNGGHLLLMVLKRELFFVPMVLKGVPPSAGMVLERLFSYGFETGGLTVLVTFWMYGKFIFHAKAGKILCVVTLTNLEVFLVSSSVLLDISFKSLEAWGATMGGLLLPLAPCILEGEYFLQTSLDLTSCHDWVVPRVMPLMHHGLLIAWMVMSVTRQVVQMGGSALA